VAPSSAVRIISASTQLESWKNRIPPFRARRARVPSVAAVLAPGQRRQLACCGDAYPPALMFRDESPGSPGSDDAARARVADPLRSSPGEEVDHVASTAQRDLADVDERRG
jgi:hypothetical protein